MKNGEGSRRRQEVESVPEGKKRKISQVRDDLTLDAFQRNYTSEDNASFVQIVDEENKRRQEDRWSWAWEAEKKAETRRIEGEEKRRMILEAATSGGWRVDGDGRRLIGGLGEGGKSDTEAWKDTKLIGAASLDGEPSGTVATSSTTALVAHVQAKVTLEAEIAQGHPLREALTAAGLPATAILSEEDGALVPHREITSGGGEGRGRGAEEKAVRDRIEQDVMGDAPRETVSLGGSGADQWKYKVSKCYN